MSVPGYLLPNLLASLQNIAAPGALFTAQGNKKNAYLSVGDIVSSSTGFPIRLNNATLVYIAATNSNNLASFEVEIYSFDGLLETLLATVVVTAARGANYKPPTPIAVSFGIELRAKVNNVGTATNCVVAVFTAGDLP